MLTGEGSAEYTPHFLSICEFSMTRDNVILISAYPQSALKPNSKSVLSHATEVDSFLHTAFPFYIFWMKIYRVSSNYNPWAWKSEKGEESALERLQPAKKALIKLRLFPK